MIELSLDEVAAATGGRVIGDGATRVRAVVTDSRRAVAGSIFVALRGEHADGHDHADSAVETGAAAILVQREVDAAAPQVVVDDTWRAIGALGAAVRDRVDPLVVAITGSVGKTTTKDLAAAALAAGGPTAAAEASFNNELGVPLTLLRVEDDTRSLVVEIGSRGLGHIAELTPLVRPDVAIVTAVAGVHLELFGDVETVARAKGELVACLPADGTAILNADDPRVAAMRERTSARAVTFAVTASDADVTAADLRVDRLGRPSFRAVTPWGDAEVRLPMAGRHNVGNALAALAAAGVAGVPIGAAADALGRATISSWRGEVSEADGLIVLNDAYNANPTSVAAALEMLQDVERTGETWAVLGVMAEIGAAHEAEHEATGRVAAERGVDHVVAVGEAAAGIARGARTGDVDVHEVADADAAAALLAQRVVAGDVVLVKASRVGGLETVAATLTSVRATALPEPDAGTDREGAS